MSTEEEAQISEDYESRREEKSRHEISKTFKKLENRRTNVNLADQRKLKHKPVRDLSL